MWSCIGGNTVNSIMNTWHSRWVYFYSTCTVRARRKEKLFHLVLFHLFLPCTGNNMKSSAEKKALIPAMNFITV